MPPALVSTPGTDALCPLRYAEGTGATRMFMHFSKRYTARVQGQVWKTVECANCAYQFVYRLRRTGTGRGSSPYYLDNEGAQRRAEERAQRQLAKALANGCEPIP